METTFVDSLKHKTCNNSVNYPKCCDHVHIVHSTVCWVSEEYSFDDVKNMMVIFEDSFMVSV